MKQGSGNSSAGERKIEPRSQAVNPGGAAQLGTAVISNPTPLYAGRGYTAPAPAATTSHKAGSQGKHK